MEVFAVAANVMAAVSLTLQLVDSIESIRQLWKGVKDAPQEIEDVIADLELLKEILDGMRKALQLRCQNGPDPVQVSSVLAALRQCQRHILRMSDFAKDLHKDCVRRRFVGGFKAACRKPILAEFSKSIEQAKTTLLLAVNVATFMLEEECSKKVLQQFSHLRSEIEIKFHPQSESRTAAGIVSETAKDSCRYRTVDTSEHQLCASDVLLWLLQLPPDSRYRKHLHQTGRLIGRVLWRSTKKQSWDSATQKRCRIISMHLPILGRSFAVESQWILGQWTHTFRATRIVPENSAIFRICATKDAVFIRQMFDSGLASPYDQTSSGISLLHVAAAGYRSETYKLLCECGVEYSLCEDPNYGKLAPIEYTQDYNIFAEGKFQTVQNWLSISNNEAVIISPESNYQNAVEIWNASVEGKEDMTDEEKMTILQGPLRLPRHQRHILINGHGTSSTVVKPKCNSALLLFCSYFLFRQDPYGHGISEAWMYSHFLPEGHPIPLWDYLLQFWHAELWFGMLASCNNMDFLGLAQRQQDKFTGISWNVVWDTERGKWVKRKRAVFSFGGESGEKGVWIGPLEECEAVFEFEILDDDFPVENGSRRNGGNQEPFPDVAGTLTMPPLLRHEGKGDAVTKLSQEPGLGWLMIWVVLFCFVYF